MRDKPKLKRTPPRALNLCDDVSQQALLRSSLEGCVAQVSNKPEDTREDDLQPQENLLECEIEAKGRDEGSQGRLGSREVVHTCDDSLNEKGT